MSKRQSYLDVDWVELGCRGWEIDETGAEAADLDPGGECVCHLDRTTLDIIMQGPGLWMERMVTDLAAAKVPGLERFRPWQMLITPPTANQPTPIGLWRGTP